MFRKLQLFRPTNNDERRGQALVEFSLTVLVFIVLLLMIIELARIMYAYVNLQHSARMAARYAVTGQWMTEYSTDPKAHYKLSPPYSPQDRIPPCWPLFNDDTAAPITPNTEPVEQSFQPYRDARTCSIERIALNNMVGLNLDPTALRAESGYYRVLVSGVGKSVDPNDTFERWEYHSPGGWTSGHEYTYQRTAAGLNIYDNPTTGFQLIAGYGGLPQQKVVVQIEYRLPIIAPVLSSIAPNVRLSATAIMTNEAFGSTGLNREAVLPPELPELPEFLDPTPTDLVPDDILGLPGALEEFQYGEDYALNVVVVNQGDQALIPPNPVAVEIYYVVGGSAPSPPSNEASVGSPFVRFGTGASLQEAIPKGEPKQFPAITGNVPEDTPGDVHFYACVDTTETVDETGSGLGLDVQANEENNCAFIATHTADIYADLEITNVNFATGKSPNPGTTMSIPVTVTNHGPSDSTGARLQLTWSPLSGASPTLFTSAQPIKNLPTIPAGGSYTTTAPLVPPFNPVLSGSAAGSWELTFTVFEGNEKDPQSPADTWVDTIAVSGVDLRITQEFEIDGTAVPSNENPVINPGETLLVRLIVENVGTNPANAVKVTHARPTNPGLSLSGVTITPLTAGSYSDSTDIWTVLPTPFPAGASATMTYQVTLVSGASGNIDWVSSASVASTSPTYNTSDDSVSSDARVARSDISVTVSTSLTPPPTPREDDQFNLIVTVTNNGEDPATNVQISAPIHADLTYISQNIQTGGGTYNQSTGLWNIGDLDVGSKTLNITVDPVTGSGVNPPFAFIAELISADQDDPDSDPNNGDVNEDDYDSIIIDVGGRVDLTVVSYDYTVNGDSSSTENEAYITDEVIYTLNIANLHDSGYARNVKVDLAPNLPFDQVFGDISYTGPGTFDASTGVWSVGDMDIDDTATLQLSLRVRAGSTLGAYPFNTTATISSAEIDPIVYNNTRSAPTLTIKPLFLNVGDGGASNCNVSRTWNGIEWIPADRLGDNGATYGLTGSGLWPTNGNDYNNVVNPNSTATDGQRIVACRMDKYGDFGFDIDNIPQGQYILSLLFVDMEYSTAGERLMDVELSIDGGASTTILDDYDIAYAAGGRRIAITEKFTLNITADLSDLDLDFIQITPPWEGTVLSGVGLEFDTSTIPTPTPTTEVPSDTTPPTNPSNLYSSTQSADTVTVAWSSDATDDDSGVAGYSVEWSNSATTVPDTTVDHVEGVFGETSPSLAPGDWYYHLRTCDNAGNCADAMHLGPFTITGSIPPGTFGPGYYEETEADLVWTGTWTTLTTTGPSGGSQVYTNKPTASVSFTIYGDTLTIYRAMYIGRGPSQVCIDGSCQTVNNFSATLLWAQPVVFSGLGSGVHTVVIRNTSSAYIDFDAFEVN